MNVKRFFGASIALFIFIFFYDWLVHGVLLMKTYEMTAMLWRPEADMKSLMPLGIFGQIFTAGWLGLAFAQFFKNGGKKNGLMFGLFFGGLIGVHSALTYVWMPIPSMLAWSWLFANFFKYLIGGYILGAIYRKK